MDEPLYLLLRPSRMLRLVMFGLHMLAGVAVWWAVPVLPALLMAVLLLLSLRWQWWCGSEAAPGFIRALRLHHQGFGELQLAESSVAVRLLPFGFDAGGLQVLHFAALADARQRYRLLLMPDSLDQLSRAALRRCLYCCPALD